MLFTYQNFLYCAVRYIPLAVPAAVKSLTRRLNVKADERSGASQKALTLSGLAISCRKTDGGKTY
jgi:hypothetical protein